MVIAGILTIGIWGISGLRMTVCSRIIDIIVEELEEQDDGQDPRQNVSETNLRDIVSDWDDNVLD